MSVVATQPIILASTSKIRQQLLDQVGLPYRSVPPEEVDEEALRAKMLGQPIAIQAQLLADAKAEVVAMKYPHHVVIGADQMAVIDGESEVLTKPGSDERAVEQLMRLAGKTHTQYSGLAVWVNGKPAWKMTAQSRLTMRIMSESDIRAYVSIDHPIHSCGAYYYESYGKHLFADIQGESDVVMGLAVTPLLSWLHQHDYISLA